MRRGESTVTVSVVNYIIVTDPTMRQPGFDLPRQSWSLLNRFWTGQGPCHAIQILFVWYWIRLFHYLGTVGVNPSLSPTAYSAGREYLDNYHHHSRNVNAISVH